LIHKKQAFRPIVDEGRILLKVDVSEVEEGWTDSQIAAALDTSIANVLRTRRQLVEEAWQLARMAESELGVLSAQCLDRRISDEQTLTRKVAVLGAKWQHLSRQSRLAIHNRGRPR